MNIFCNTPFKTPLLLKLALVTSLALPLPATTAPLTLATAPLASATTTQVLPNLMYILDDSGSMDSDFVPDWADSSNLALFRNPEYNGMYYNPAIRYSPPAFFDASGLNTTTYLSQVGTTLATGADTAAAMPNWRKVKRDAYGVQSTSIDNLVGVALHYTFIAGEYCTAIDLKTCVASATPIVAVAPAISYTFPAPLRWCSSAANASAVTPVAGSCQAVRVGSFTNGRNPVQSKATINVTGASGNLPITGITVSGQQIMSGATAGSNTASTIASNIAAAINNCTMTLTGSCTTIGFSATVSGSTVTILAPAPTTVTPVVAVTPGTNSRATITINSANSASVTVITVGASGPQIMSAATSASNSATTVASRIVTAINACTAAITGTCTVSGYSASASGSTVTIIAPTSTSATPILSNLGTLSKTITAFVPDNVTSTIAAFAPGNNIPGTELLTIIDPSVTSYPFPNTAAKSAARGDCALATCTYAEEMINYANWWTYYRTRMQSMKSSTSIAFKTIDTRYRVGFSTILYTGSTDGPRHFNISLFDSPNKATWYGKLFAANPDATTPLRGALSKAGRYFAKKLPGQTFDPVQYSCQQNFALLTTDGYWNKGAESASYKNLDLAGGLIGNMDGPIVPAPTPPASATVSRPMYEGSTASAGSLADIAKYYYDTDLRTSALGNCTGALGLDVCDNNVFVSGTDNNVQQHMTTFTLGLGVVGNLLYTSDYKTAGSGDFFNLKKGLGSPTVNWPDPLVASASNTVESRIDDLWHAAVNGQGTYFSARDPTTLTASLSAALKAIDSKVGAGAAAATSTLNPVAGDNFAYVASYTTVKWTGNLEARSINTITGVVSEDATWCAEDVVAASCAAPSALVQSTSGASTIYTCVTPGATSATCVAPSVIDGTECKLEVPTACAGTMASRVSTVTDDRAIYTKTSTGILGAFTYANLTASQQAFFDTTFLAANLSQWGAFSVTQKALAVGANFVNFLRGQTGFEDRTSNLADNRLFRFRETVMADALESKPAFIAKTTFSYLDPGYAAFKTAQASRAGTVYIGTNDGMLHAFDSLNGVERWAYVPSMVIPNMWKLADTSYSSRHAHYVNGDSIISDVCTANCTNAAMAVWKTILVAGLNGGGRGYFALDITNPVTPLLLWEFDTTTDNDLGYTFGNSEITKKSDGTWVVLFTSGYNNTTGTNPGKGFLYVRHAYTGAAVDKYPTGAGDSTTPSGLSRITTFTEEAEKNNTASFTYGGDLSGNLWRFDINSAPASGSNPLLFATLFSDAAGTVPQPITTRPELGIIDKKRVVFVGTGKYLELTDLTTTQTQTIYAIMDDDATSTLVNPRTSLVQQTITTSGSTRNVTSTNVVNFTTGRGWYVNLPEAGERQNVASQLVSGTLLIPTTVPSATVCSPGGTGWLNFLDFKTGGAVTLPSTNTLVSSKTNAPIVGINVIYVPKDPNDPLGPRVPVVSVVTADKPTPEIPPDPPPFKSGTSAFQQKRVIWRELTQ